MPCYRDRPDPSRVAAARDPRIREAVIHGVDSGLVERTGPDRAGADPDLLVAVHGWAVNRIDADVRLCVWASSSRYYPTLATTSVDVHQYRDGTLLVDLIDGQTKQLVWRGPIDTFDPGSEASTVSKAISETLKEYPPRQ
jgi:hypothetical protein